MGAFLEKPNTEKLNEAGVGKGLRYGLSSMQGWRLEMEDSHSAITELPKHLKEWSFFAIFDGHAGSSISEKCSTQLIESILATKQFSNPNPSEEDVKAGMREGFLSLDQKLRINPDMDMEDKSGSTAVCVLISPTHFYFANCGDSRAILVRNKTVHFSTIDHKPTNTFEKERIINAGGSVMIQRVNGSLAVSRALGDYDYKKVEGRGPTEQLVSPDPEIDIIRRDLNADEFIILACDGVWDVMSNEELNVYIQHRLRVSNDFGRVCNEVIDTCLYKGSRDNMSISIIAFDNAPSVDPLALQEDNKLDEKLKHEIDDYLKKLASGDVEIADLISHLTLLDLKTYPPGGIITKRHLIDAQYNEYLQKSAANNHVHTEGSKNKP